MTSRSYEGGILYEKDVEDWVCDHVDEVLGFDLEEESLRNKAVLVGRQLPLSRNRALDVLTLHRELDFYERPLSATPEWRDGDDYYGTFRYQDEERFVFTVIEIKRDRVDERTIGQVLGYCGELRYALHNIVRDLIPGSARSTIRTRVRCMMVGQNISYGAIQAIAGLADEQLLDFYRIDPTVWEGTHPTFLTPGAGPTRKAEVVCRGALMESLSLATPAIH